MKSNTTVTAHNKKKRKSGDACFEIPSTRVVDISIEESEHECVRESIEGKTDKQLKGVSKGKNENISKESIEKKGDDERKKGKLQKRKRDSSKRKREISRDDHNTP